VATLPRLGKLVLYGGRSITDQALKKLWGMSSLHTLELNNTRVTNEGLRIFSSFPRLRSLAVFCEPRIGVLNDFGVVNLKSLSTLETLSLPGGWAFPEAVTQLRARLPNCRVVTNPPTGDPPGTK
jgi:hypothetical protein